MEKKNPLIKFKLDILDNMKKKTSNIISQFNSLYELIEHNYKNINECSKNLLNEIDNDITWLENYENFSIEENNKKEQQFCNEIKLLFNEYYEKIEFIIENIFTKKIITLKEDLNNLLDGLSNFNPTKINSLSNDISSVNINISIPPEYNKDISIPPEYSFSRKLNESIKKNILIFMIQILKKMNLLMELKIIL